MILAISLKVHKRDSFVISVLNGAIVQGGYVV